MLIHNDLEEFPAPWSASRPPAILDVIREDFRLFLALRDGRRRACQVLVEGELRRS